MYNAIVVSGAYGRDYSNELAAVLDWNAGRDFRIRSINARGSYTSKDDIEILRNGHFTHVHIRFNKDQDIAVLDIQAGNQHIKLTCPSCLKTFEFDVPAMEYDLWKHGVLIQNAMPKVHVAMREMLITGICGECFDKLCPPDEDDEYEITEGE